MIDSTNAIWYVINDKHYIGFKSVTKDRELRKYIRR